VIYDHSIAHAEAPAARPGFYDLAAGFMTRNHSLVSFGTFTQVLVINAANVGTANGGCLDSQQNLSMRWMRHGQRTKLNSVATRQERGMHILLVDCYLLDLLLSSRIPSH
jgi:hypothetical protein